MSDVRGPSFKVFAFDGLRGTGLGTAGPATLAAESLVRVLPTSRVYLNDATVEGGEVEVVVGPPITGRVIISVACELSSSGRYLKTLDDTTISLQAPMPIQDRPDVGVGVQLRLAKGSQVEVLAAPKHSSWTAILVVAGVVTALGVGYVLLKE